MTVRIASWRRAWRAGWLAAIVALVPLPAVAGPAGTGQQASTLAASMKRIVDRDMASAASSSFSSAARRPAVRAARQTPAAGTSGSFFKTRPGIIALAVMAAGTGFALYSATHDRIHSPGKE